MHKCDLSPSWGIVKSANSDRFLAQWPDSVGRRQAQTLPKMIHGTWSEILEAQQRFVGCFADLADCLQARRRQYIPYASGKSDVFDKRIVRQFRCWIYQTSFAHFPFTLSPELDQAAHLDGWVFGFAF
jgi:hypothetical protein